VAKKKTKKRLGRPTFGKEKQLQRTVSLSETYMDKLEAIGDGNISAGIRKAVDAYENVTG